MSLKLCICGREQRGKCPECFRFVAIVDGKISNHEIPSCMGSHMEYKTCKQSGKTFHYEVIYKKINGQWVEQ